MFEFEIYYDEPNLVKRNVDYLTDELETLVSQIYLKHKETINFNDVFSC